MFLKKSTMKSITNYSDKINLIYEKIRNSNAILVGAGAGLSNAAGLTYSGMRFREYFGDFIEKYNLTDMYSAGFYSYDSLEEYWAYWSRHVYYNRYNQPKTSVYEKLLNLLEHKEYFILTTNVDHCFQLSGFDKDKLFYTQGDYGLWQCSVPCKQKTYDNKKQIFEMVKMQNNMKIPTALIPHCPECGAPMKMNLRCDSTFVQDEGWYRSYVHYDKFIKENKTATIMYLELGVGMNTPSIIKYPFWKYTKDNPKSTYVCINKDDAQCDTTIQNRAICINEDISKVISDLTFDNTKRPVGIRSVPS